MKKNGEERHINVGMSSAFLDKLTEWERKRGFKSHLEALQHMVEGGADDCWMEILLIDDADPKPHSIVFVHENTTYRWKDGQFTFMGPRMDEAQLVKGPA